MQLTADKQFLNQIQGIRDRIFRVTKRILISHEEAEDATQELLFKLWKSKEKISDYNNIEAFAMTMTKNYCYDRLKSKQASNLTLVHTNYKEKETPLDKKVEDQESSKEETKGSGSS